MSKTKKKGRASRGRYGFKMALVKFVTMNALFATAIVAVLLLLPMNDKMTTVTVGSGDGAVKLCRKIAADKAYNYPRLLCSAIRLESLLGRTYFPGQHAVNRGTTIFQFIQKMYHLSMHDIVVPEGLTVYEVKEILKADPCVVGPFPDDVEEGSLMPDTYKFACGATAKAVVAKMKEAMDLFLTNQWDARGKDANYLKSKQDALVLASIVEKEAKMAQERSLVASVFRNRLKKGMRLQMCSTVIYALTKGKGQASFGRKLYFKDLSVDSQYNTYKHAGLPPTPICNPGRKAILATLEPADTNYLFFVSDKNGGHKFFEKFNDHVVFKNKMSVVMD